jgi:hypothetical protein
VAGESTVTRAAPGSVAHAGPSQKPAIRAPLARAPCRRAHNPVVTQAREPAVGDRVVAFAAGSLTLPPGQLDQPALIEPRSGAFMHHGGSFMGNRGPFMRRFKSRRTTTRTPTSERRQPQGWGPDPIGTPPHAP